MTDKHKVCIVGSGNWGSAIAKVIGPNCATMPEFEDSINMWVHEEIVQERRLSDIINTTHENVKYLPGHQLPANVHATSDLLEAASNADILIFVVPHHHIPGICKTLVGHISSNIIAVSLIKGFDKPEYEQIELTSHVISRILQVPCSVMVGANLAREVAAGNFSETTLGFHSLEHASVLTQLFQTHNFRVILEKDAEAVEVCAALKNIVGCAAGFVDGMHMGDNTKAAVMRLGLMEMVHFVEEFLSNSKLSTFLESSGIGDLIATCYGGRTRLVAEAFIKSSKTPHPKTFLELQNELLNGMSLQGPSTAATVAHLCEKKGVEGRFPLFIAIHEICTQQLPPEQLITRIWNHPEYRKLL